MNVATATTHLGVGQTTDHNNITPTATLKLQSNLAHPPRYACPPTRSLAMSK